MLPLTVLLTLFLLWFLEFLDKVVFIVIGLLQIYNYGATGAEALKTMIEDLFTNQIPVED